MSYQNHPKPVPSCCFHTKTLEKTPSSSPVYPLRTAKMHQNSQEVAETIKTIEPGNVEKRRKGPSKLLQDEGRVQVGSSLMTCKTP